MEPNNKEILQSLYIAGSAVASELGRMRAPSDEAISSADFYNAMCEKPGKCIPYTKWPANTPRNKIIRRLVDDYRAAGEIDIHIENRGFALDIPSSQVFWVIHKFEQLCNVKSKDKFRIKFQLINNTYIPTIMASKITETPLMQQYAEMKAKHPDAILLFRIGDFYETFKEDAVAVSEILGITLTRRALGAGGYTELAGFPHCSLDTYLPKLVRAGKRVAICEELDDKQKIKKEIEPEEPKVEEPKVEEPKPAPEPTLKAELRECALAQLPAGVEIVAAKYVPIGEDNGKWQLVLKKDDVYRYADIVAMARYLYICDRVFDTAEDVATLVGVELPAPKPAPEIAPESTPTDETTDMVKMFMDEYGMDNDAALMLADKNHALKENLLSEKSVTFTFRKKDGSLREAHGTLHPDVIPAVEHDPSRPERTPNPKFQTYYDLDKQQWRCFEKANLIDVELPF